MSIEAMKMALEFIESTNKSAALWMVPDTPLTKTVTALRNAIEQAENQSASGSYVSWDNTLCNALAPAREQAKSAWYDGYASAKAEQNDRIASLENTCYTLIGKLQVANLKLAFRDLRPEVEHHAARILNEEFGEKK